MGLSFYNGECETSNRGQRNPPETATITKKGHIRVNSAIVKQLPNMRTVTFAADRESDPVKIILKLVRDDHDSNYTKRLHVSGGTSLATAAKGFLGWCGVDFEKIGTKLYPAHYDEGSRQIIIRLVR